MLKLETIERALESGDAAAHDVALAALGRHDDIPLSTIVKWLESGERIYQVAAFHAAIRAQAPSEFYHRLAKVYAECDYQEMVGDAIREAHRRHTFNEYYAVEKLLPSSRPELRELAFDALYPRSPVWMIMLGLEDNDPLVAKAAVYAAEKADVPRVVLDRWINTNYQEYRLAAAVAMQCRGDVPFAWVAKLMGDSAPSVAFEAARICDTRLIPNRFFKLFAQRIEQRQASIYEELAVVMNFIMRKHDYRGWSEGKAARRWKKLIHGLVYSESPEVRCGAVHALNVGNLELVRDIEPDGPVYSLCVGDVMVLARVERESHIRANLPRFATPEESRDYDPLVGSYRASQIEVVDVQGSFYGEKVGIWRDDHDTECRVGTRIIVGDFDMASTEQPATGYQFYLTEKAAREHRW